MKNLLIQNCTNPLAKAVWIKHEYQEECLKMLEVLPYIESVSGALGPTQITVLFSALAEQEEIDTVEGLLRAITGPEE